MKKVITIILSLALTCCSLVACSSVKSSLQNQQVPTPTAEATEPPYKFVDSRNTMYYELGNGKTLEYFATYEDYVSSVYGMTSYQYAQREFEYDGLYVKISGAVRNVSKDGTISIFCGNAGNTILDDRVYAEIVPSDSQTSLLSTIDKDTSILAFARIDDSSYSKDGILTVSFELYDPIIVQVGGSDIDVPQGFTPQYSKPSTQPDEPVSAIAAPTIEEVNQFLTAFSEQYVYQCTKSDTDAMVDFAFTWLQIHKWNLLTYGDDGFVYAKADGVAQVVKDYFGISITNHASTDWLEYGDGQYYTYAANPPSESCIVKTQTITEKGNGKYNIEFDLEYSNSEYAGYGSAVVVVTDSGLNLVQYEATYY